MLNFGVHLLLQDVLLVFHVDDEDELAVVLLHGGEEQGAADVGGGEHHGGGEKGELEEFFSLKIFQLILCRYKQTDQHLQPLGRGGAIKIFSQRISAGLYIKNTHNDFNGCTSRISLSISLNFTIFAVF